MEGFVFKATCIDSTRTLFIFSARWTLPMTDVLAVRYGDDWIHGVNLKEKQPPPTSPTSPTVCPTNFILHYAVRGPKNKWSHHSVTMSHTDPRQVASWVKTIRNYLMGELQSFFIPCYFIDRLSYSEISLGIFRNVQFSVIEISKPLLTR